jgi:membrane protein required for colicin V production
MNILDIIILIPFVWFAWRGFKKGLIIELATLVALFIGIYFGAWLSSIVADFMFNTWKITSHWMPVIAYAITFLLIIIGVFALAKMLEKSANLLALGLANKLTGAFFALLKTVFIVSLILFLINKVNLIPEKTRKESLIYNPVSSVAPYMIPKLKAETIKVDSVIKKEN